MILLPRQYNNCYYDRFNNYRCTNGRSTWNSWARWLVLGLIILGIIFVFFLFSCVTSRRRRKRGFQPYRGTGWALGRTPPGHGAATYNPPPGQQTQQPYYAQPQTQQPYYNNSNNPPPSYYDASANRGGNNDVELQTPQPAYGGAGGQYQPPKGPPPGHA